MTLEELRKIDTYGAFADFITIRQAKDIGLLPSVYENCFKDHCECGSEFIITNKLTQPQCCDPKCYIKLGYALAELFSRFGCSGIAESTCGSIMKDMYKKLKLPSHIELLNLLPNDYPSCLLGAKGFDYSSAIDQVKFRVITFPEMISLIAIPKFGKEDNDLLSKYVSLVELLEDIKKHGGIQLFFNSHGIYDKMKLFYFTQFLNDIALAETILCSNIRRTGLTKLEICVTGKVYPDGEYMDGKYFITYCNAVAKLSNGTQLFEISESSAMTSVPYIVADAQSSSRKYLAGKRRNVLISSTDFVNLIKKEVQKCEEMMKNYQKT